MDGKVIVKTSGRMVDTSKCSNLGHSWQGPFFFSEITRPFSKNTSFGCFGVNNRPNPYGPTHMAEPIWCFRHNHMAENIHCSNHMATPDYQLWSSLFELEFCGED